MEENNVMPEESSSSWTKLLADLVRGFILLRDVFGYLLPGVLFLLIGAQSGHLSSFADVSRLSSMDLPRWVVVLLLLVISYMIGHFLVATFYFIPDLIGLIKQAIRKLKKKEPDAEKEKARSELLRYHKEYPDIFIELDRQSILALLRVGLAGSLLLGLLVFYGLYPHPLRVMAAAGVLMLINTIFGGVHLKELRKASVKAAKDSAKDAGKPAPTEKKP